MKLGHHQLIEYYPSERTAFENLLHKGNIPLILNSFALNSILTTTLNNIIEFERENQIIRFHQFFNLQDNDQKLLQ
jgi:hypothetical protein